MTSVFSKSFLLAGAMALGSLSIAMAQPASTPSAPEAKAEMRKGGMRGEGPRRGHHRDPEKHAQHLRDVLQLTAAQEPALQAFLAATGPATHDMHKPGGPAADKGERKALTTPERLDRQAEMMGKHQAAFEKRAAATRVFYGQLTASQKKAFDALPMMHGPRMMHGKDGMRRM